MLMITNIQKLHKRDIDITCLEFSSDVGFCTRWIPIDITGRWKVVNTNGESRLYLEMKEEKGFFKRRIITTWISEYDLEFIHEEIYINECGGRNEYI